MENGKKVPIGYQKINCHMVFDVKMERTKVPATVTCVSVVSRETVCIALMLAALNDLEVEVVDIQNNYIIQ